LISGSHLRTLCEIWVGVIECLLGTTIKKLQMSDVYTWDPFKNPKMGVSIVDALSRIIPFRKAPNVTSTTHRYPMKYE